MQRSVRFSLITLISFLDTHLAYSTFPLCHSTELAHQIQQLSEHMTHPMGLQVSTHDSEAELPQMPARRSRRSARGSLRLLRRLLSEMFSRRN
jgi:hypothetical protein